MRVEESGRKLRESGEVEKKEERREEEKWFCYQKQTTIYLLCFVFDFIVRYALHVWLIRNKLVYYKESFSI